MNRSGINARLVAGGRAAVGISGLVAIATALALSGCGGTTTSTSTSTVAAQAVTVAITSPPGGSVINANSVAVRGTVDPPSATVEVAGQPAAVGNGVFTASANLQRGKTTIDVIGSESGNSPGSTSIVITRPGNVEPAKSAGGTSTGSTATPSIADAQPGSETGGQTSCSGGLSVGPDTSCAFAENVQSTYYTNGAGTYEVNSPVTGDNYSMTCEPSGGEIACTGGNNASVYFPG